MRVLAAAVLGLLAVPPASAELKCPKGFHAELTPGPVLKLPKEARARRKGKRRKGEDGPPLVRSRRGGGKEEEAGGEQAPTGQRCVADAAPARREQEEPPLDPVIPEKDAGAAVPQMPLPPP
jgi:hypothetical protein